jgi:hypothetical protein
MERNVKMNTKKSVRFKVFTATVCNEVMSVFYPTHTNFPDINPLHQPLKMQTEAVFETLNTNWILIMVIARESFIAPKNLFISDNISIILNSVLFNYVHFSHFRIWCKTCSSVSEATDPQPECSGPPGMGWASYTPRHNVPLSSPPTTRRDKVEVLDPASTRAVLQSLSQSYFATGGLQQIISSWRQASWSPRPQEFFQLNPCGNSLYVTSSLYNL